MTDVFNMILTEKKWPAQWKTEFVTIIPKIPSPEQPAECRNISCTNLLSKVFERIVIEVAKQEVKPKLNQFGGEPGASTTHMLMSVINYTLNAIEDNRAAVVLSTVDFSKAFNRLQHRSCLETFVKRGASSETLQLLTTFLFERKMTVKVEKEWSEPRCVNAGAPQGSVLGCYLFNIGVDDLEEDVDFTAREPVEVREHLTQTDDYTAFSTPTRVGLSGQDLGLSPIVRADYAVDFLPRIANVPPWLRQCTEKKWKDQPALTVKFVVDSINSETVNMKEVPLLFIYLFIYLLFLLRLYLLQVAIL